MPPSILLYRSLLLSLNVYIVISSQVLWISNYETNLLGLCMYVRACVWTSMRKRERDRKRMCVCVCVIYIAKSFIIMRRTTYRARWRSAALSPMEWSRESRIVSRFFARRYFSSACIWIFAHAYIWAYNNTARNVTKIASRRECTLYRRVCGVRQSSVSVVKISR